MTDSLLQAIEKGLGAARMTPSRFGRLAANDPRLVFDLRRGRVLRGATEARVRAFLFLIAEGDAPCGH
jgi:hypothetical protein